MINVKEKGLLTALFSFLKGLVYNEENSAIYIHFKLSFFNGL